MVNRKQRKNGAWDKTYLSREFLSDLAPPIRLYLLFSSTSQ
jgi:hypothetical protein